MPFGRDSFENLALSEVMYRVVTGREPRKRAVITMDFKFPRFQAIASHLGLGEIDCVSVRGFSVEKKTAPNGHTEEDSYRGLFHNKVALNPISQLHGTFEAGRLSRTPQYKPKSHPEIADPYYEDLSKYIIDHFKIENRQQFTQAMRHLGDSLTVDSLNGFDFWSLINQSSANILQRASH